uniref:Acyl-CoA oxidase n=1 Tax=Panagrolaimus sp. JU765 TaxID=591449 RepID=A0AC34PVX0_9BILA
MGTDGHPLGIHFIMGIPAILNNADDEQLKQWLPKVMNNEYVLAYAQTELGHGTNLKNLETTAIFDSKTQEFVLNSPTITSTKWWPGNLGKSSNWSIVMAQLIIGKKNYGPHPFFVQIRDSETHEPLPRLIPRTSLMMKHAKVLSDGTYVPAIHPKLGYLTMIVVRAAVVTVASEYLSKACVIATRYSAIRRQGEIIPGTGEVKILDYQTQQYRIFPQIARAIAFRFSGIYLLEMNNHVSKQLETGKTEELADLHAFASGIKAVSTYQASLGIEQCRMSCGGHGYSLASGLPQLYSSGVASCTYEGENMVMLLQLARYLRKRVKEYKIGKSDIQISSLAKFLFESNPKKSRIGTTNANANEIEAAIESFEHVARRLIFETFEKTEKLQKQGMTSEIAMNQTSVEWRRASHAFTRVIIAKIFQQNVQKCDNFSTKKILNQLLKLFVFYEIG